MTPEVREELLLNIKRRLTPQPVKIRSGMATSGSGHFRSGSTAHLALVRGERTVADIDLTCFSYEGIDGVIAALKAAEQVSTNDIQIKVCARPRTLVRSPGLSLTAE